MLRHWGRLLSGQRGSAMTTSLMMATALTLVSVSMISVTRNLRKNRDVTDSVTADRRLNESALQIVTQLISNGLLYYEPTCRRVQPTIRNSAFADHVVATEGAENETSDYEVSGCGQVRRIDNEQSLSCQGGDSSKWLYVWDEVEAKAYVHVCVIVTNKTAGKTESKVKPVLVSFNGYEEKADEENNNRTFGLVRSRPQVIAPDTTKHASLNGRISLGLTSGNKGLMGRHGAADTCFYMRPLTAKQGDGSLANMAFRERKGTGAYSLAELEPRPDGPNADEFQVKTNLGIPAPVEDDYAILNGFREKKLVPTFKQGYRGGRATTSNWGASHAAYNQDIMQAVRIPDVIRNTFIGVLPNINNGPRFEYFLYAVPGTQKPVVHYQDRYKFNAADEEGLLYGCNTTTKRLGLMNSGFCTKVYMPLANYTATFRRRCVQSTQTLPSVPPGSAPTVMTADRAIMTTCHPQWIDAVEKVVKEINSHSHGIFHNNTKDEDDFSAEITADMAISAMEVDENFLDGTGPWADLKKAQSPAYSDLRVLYRDFKDKFNASGQSVTDKLTVRHESDVDRLVECNCTTDKDGNTTCQTCLVKGETRSFTIYGLENAGGQMQHAHTSNSCAYFRYHDPTDPKKCKIEYITKDKADWVCRNNDGCFDELTKIRMADGTDRLMTQLRKGDFVYNPVTQRPAKIVKLTMGPETKPLIHVTVGDSTVRVTETHPFMTRRGWVMAKNLRSKDIVLSSGGRWSAVSYVTVGDAGRTVVNLALEGPAEQADLHYVLADGVVTGDLVIQNMITPRVIRSSSSSDKVEK